MRSACRTCCRAAHHGQRRPLTTALHPLITARHALTTARSIARPWRPLVPRSAPRSAPGPTQTAPTTAPRPTRGAPTMARRPMRRLPRRPANPLPRLPPVLPAPPAQSSCGGASTSAGTRACVRTRWGRLPLVHASAHHDAPSTSPQVRERACERDGRPFTELSAARGARRGVHEPRRHRRRHRRRNRRRHRRRHRRNFR